jgi:hypothetical protein
LAAWFSGGRAGGPYDARMSVRRRQRSLRLTFAVGLLALASLVVFVAVAYKDATWLSGAAVFGLFCGVAATRTFSNELADVRREHARDRVRQADAYAQIAEERATEHKSFVSSMSKRLTDRTRTISHLKGTVRLCESRIEQAEHRVKRESNRANEAQEQLAEVLSERHDLEAEAAALMVASGIIEDAAEMPAIVNLMAWESRVAAAANPSANSGASAAANAGATAGANAGASQAATPPAVSDA